MTSDYKIGENVIVHFEDYSGGPDHFTFYLPATVEDIDTSTGEIEIVLKESFRNQINGFWIAEAISKVIFDIDFFTFQGIMHARRIIRQNEIESKIPHEYIRIIKESGPIPEIGEKRGIRTHRKNQTID